VVRLEQLIKKYLERFNENVPLFMLSGLSDDEIKTLLEDCLTKGEPYRPDDKSANIVY
jgi:hypothetical protein